MWYNIARRTVIMNDSIWRRFDFIGVADYTSYKWRVDRLDRGLVRVGIGNRT